MSGDRHYEYVLSNVCPACDGIGADSLVQTHEIFSLGAVDLKADAYASPSRRRSCTTCGGRGRVRVPATELLVESPAPPVLEEELARVPALSEYAGREVVARPPVLVWSATVWGTSVE